MRVLVTADLHYRPAQRETFMTFARWAEAQQPDCFILAGDVGHPLRLFRRGLQLFGALACPRLLVAGNHDVYTGDHDSRSLWEAHLPAAASDEGFVWLEDESFRLHGVGFCGTMGWYDYSSRAPHLPFSDHEYRLLKHMVNHDADFVDWPWSDRAMARYLAKRFAARLSVLETDAQVQSIVVVTHMPIFDHALPNYPQSEEYSLQRAYLGNFTLGDLVRQHAKVTHVCSGHLHRAGRWKVEGERSQIDFRVIGSKIGQPRGVMIIV